MYFSTAIVFAVGVTVSCVTRFQRMTIEHSFGPTRQVDDVPSTTKPVGVAGVVGEPLR
jgi:hypothetical protein